MIDAANKRVCVVMVNYRTAVLVLDSVATLCKQLDADLDHIVVVDNCSGGDDLALMISAIEQRELSSLVSVVASPENGGFSAGNNIGIRSVRAEYYLLANADTQFRPDAIKELWRLLKKIVLYNQYYEKFSDFR